MTRCELCKYAVVAGGYLAPFGSTSYRDTEWVEDCECYENDDCGVYLDNDGEGCPYFVAMQDERNQ